MNPEHIETDLGCAAFLDATGYELVDLREVSPTRSGFAFRDPFRTAERDVAAYFGGAIVTAEKLAISIRKLKAMLRATKQNEKMERRNYAHPHAVPRQ